MVSMSDWIIIYLLEQHSEKINTQLKADQPHPLECCIVHLPSRHGPDCPPVVVIVGDRTVRTVLLL